MKKVAKIGGILVGVLTLLTGILAVLYYFDVDIPYTKKYATINKD
jgi:hypothetical protein